MTRNFFGHQSFKGRGAASNVPGRFDALNLEQTDDGWYQDEIVENLTETVLPDRARSVIRTAAAATAVSIASPARPTPIWGSRRGWILRRSFSTRLMP